MTDQRELLEDVPVLVEAHMRPRALFLAKSGDAAIRRLSDAVGRIDRLLRVCKADAMGSRFHESEDFQETERWLTSRAEADYFRAPSDRPRAHAGNAFYHNFGTLF